MIALPNPLPRRSFRLARLGRSLLPASLLAPTLAWAAPARTTPAETAAADEVITIPEFQVTDTRQVDSWVTAQAMSGTRTAAPVIELPYQVQVLTSDFLEDFQAIGLTEQMSFFTAYSGVADQADPAIGATLGGSSLRGFSQTILRDGFRRTPPPQMANTAQVEIIKGPMSTLYGDASPGGLVNYVSRRPTVRPSYQLSLATGSYDYLRGSLLASGPLYKNKLFYLFSADDSYRAAPIQYVHARTRNYVGTLLFKPTATTSLSVNFEATRLTGARGATVPSLVVGTRKSGTNPLNWTGGIIQGIDWRLARTGYSRFGPQERYGRDYDGVNVMLEHAYSSNWKQRLAYQGQWKNFNLVYRTNSNVAAETNRMAGVEPNQRFQEITSPVNLQTDLLGHFQTGKIPHALLITADYSEERTRDKQIRLTTAEAAALPDYYRYHDPFNPDWTYFDYSRLSRRAAKNYENIDAHGFSVSDRIFLAGGKLVVMGNTRYDKAKYAEDSSTTVDQFTFGNDDGFTYSAGANWKLRGDALVLFLNRSTSFNNNPTVDRGTGTTIPNERGEGSELGVKSLAFDQRLGLTASVYEIEKTNIGQTNPDYIAGNGLPQYLGTGRERVRGVDADCSWKLNELFTVIGGASYLDARVTASSNAALVNTRKVQVPRTTAALSLRCTLPGQWKGLRLGYSFRYTGEYVRANATSSRLYEEGAPRQMHGFFLGYTWKEARCTHTVRLNGVNVFDKFYVGPDGNVGMGRQINTTYSLSFK